MDKAGCEAVVRLVVVEEKSNYLIVILICDILIADVGFKCKT